MADIKISALPAATTPLVGTEVLPIVQSSTTKQVSIANLTAGRAISASNVTNAGLTSGRVTYAGTAGLLQDSANLTFNGTTLTAAAVTSTGVATFSAGAVGAAAITTSGDTNTGIFFPAADTIAFTDGGVESLRISSTGLLLTGGTTATFSMPSTGGVSFKGSTTAGGSPIVEIGNTDTTSGSDSSPALMIFKGSTTTGINARFIQFSANGSGTTMGAIVGAASGLCAFANYSDISLKKNIQPLSGSLSKIIALKPSSFDMVSDSSHVNAGFIAQDVQKVYPEYVIENMANEGEKPLMAITGGMSGGFIAELVKAIQELKAEFDAYKATHP
jgi:hypothetical protein